MKRRALALGFACILLDGLATWSAFHGSDTLTNCLFTLHFVCLLILVVTLCRHKGDWWFHGTAFAVIIAYVSFMVYVLCEFLTKAD
jgi:lipoprotein signal peptidase